MKGGNSFSLSKESKRLVHLSSTKSSGKSKLGLQQNSPDIVLIQENKKPDRSTRSFIKSMWSSNEINWV